ncbi:hypothetical protein [Streptococcus gallolyticus]|uniref:hypothetical protein n=1 Tax=Streptococcus gallolyticus TaxID=315405 RepID=UPI002283F072|nr:hypothetical protein [Streptococcus gallolyticus]MCY7187309.1 hypothetical protein [Streptococcus gallolyticus subsp. gallolyticus]
MTEKIYQRPPKKDEIKEFLNKVKFAIFFSLLALTASALLVGSLYLLQFKSTQDLVEYAIQKLGVLAALVLLTLAMTICSYDAEMSRYFIYKRYRFGHFSNMMIAYISALALQVIAIVVAISFKVVIPLVVFELLASIYLFIELKKSKDSRPPLARPLTSEENECRKEIIEGLVEIIKSYIEIDIAESDVDSFMVRSFALFATFSEQDPEGSKRLFTKLKEQDYSEETRTLLLKFLNEIDTDVLDANRYNANWERAFKLFYRIIFKSPTKTDHSVRKEFYDYFE